MLEMLYTVFPLNVCVVPMVPDVCEMPITDAAVPADDCLLYDVRFLTVLFWMVFEPEVVWMPLVRACELRPV